MGRFLRNGGERWHTVSLYWPGMLRPCLRRRTGQTHGSPLQHRQQVPHRIASRTRYTHHTHHTHHTHTPTIHITRITCVGLIPPNPSVSLVPREILFLFDRWMLKLARGFGSGFRRQQRRAHARTHTMTYHQEVACLPRDADAGRWCHRAGVGVGVGPRYFHAVGGN